MFLVSEICEKNSDSECSSVLCRQLGDSPIEIDCLTSLVGQWLLDIGSCIELWKFLSILFHSRLSSFFFPSCSFMEHSFHEWIISDKDRNSHSRWHRNESPPCCSTQCWFRFETLPPNRNKKRGENSNSFEKECFVNIEIFTQIQLQNLHSIRSSHRTFRMRCLHFGNCFGGGKLPIVYE